MAKVKQSPSLSVPSSLCHEEKGVIRFLREGSKTIGRHNSCLLFQSRNGNDALSGALPLPPLTTCLSPPQNLAEFFLLIDGHSTLWFLQLASVLLSDTEFHSSDFLFAAWV